MDGPPPPHDGQPVDLQEMMNRLRELKTLLLSNPTPSNEWRVKQLERQIERLDKEMVGCGGGQPVGGRGRGRTQHPPGRGPGLSFGPPNLTFPSPSPSPSTSPSPSSSSIPQSFNRSDSSVPQSSIPSPSPSHYRDRVKVTELKVCSKCGTLSLSI
jgi:hypothetical protein